VGSVNEAVRDFAHGIEVLLRILDVLEALSVVRLDAALNEGLERPLMLVPLLNLRVDDRLRLLGHRGGFGRDLACRLPGARLFLAGLLLLGVILPLPAPGGRGGSRGGRRGGRGHGAVVVVHAPHVVPQVPLPGETMASVGALTALVGAQIRLLAVSVHGVGLTLMPEETGGRREPGILATLNLAAVRLEVGIHELAAGGVS
jgi:hypothetical protein